MVEKSTVGWIMVSVLLSIILTSGGMYLALPYIFPAINSDTSNFAELEDLDEYQLANETTDDGILLNTQYSVIPPETHEIYDYNLTDQIIPGCEINFTTQGGSRLVVYAELSLFLRIDDTFAATDYTRYNITLTVDGIYNISKRVYYDQIGGPLSVTLTFANHIPLTVQTNELAQGTHYAEIHWGSIYNSIGESRLYTTSQYPQLFYIQELKA